MICGNCQTRNPDEASACVHCGGSLAVATITAGAVVDERYEIMGQLGGGGMGVVYRAHDRFLDEVVALKVLRPEVARSEAMARRFRSEIKLARKVTHPNVCRIHEYGEDGDLRFISMELLEGIDLKHLLRRRGPLPAADAYDIALQVAEGLQAIHNMGIVHRDLKTANIMVDPRGVVRLMDFGIAKEVHSDSGLTATGFVVGTPTYMSPEQARGRPLDARSDVYSLGVVIYEMFTGEAPFRGETPMSVILKHIEEPPPLAGGAAAALPSLLAAVLRRALAKEPEDRYPSVRALIDALRGARDETAPPGLATARLTSAAPEPLPEAESTPARTAVPTAVATAVETRVTSEATGSSTVVGAWHAVGKWRWKAWLVIAGAAAMAYLAFRPSPPAQRDELASPGPSALPPSSPAATRPVAGASPGGVTPPAIRSAAVTPSPRITPAPAPSPTWERRAFRPSSKPSRTATPAS
jgi:serine/threonine-protein kinase